MEKIPISIIFPSGVAMWSVFLLFSASVVGISSSPDTHIENSKENVHRECGYTRYPDLCMDTLLGLGHQHGDILPALVEKIRDETKMPTSNPSHKQVGLLTQRAHVSTIGDCEELMEMSVKRLNQSLYALKDSPSKNKLNIQTWLSAVLTFQQSCKDSVKDFSDDLVLQISGEMDHLSKLASNALALVNRISGHRKNTTRPDGNFPTWVYRRDRKLLQATVIHADAVVAQDGTGNYRTISEAINAASGGRYVIHVKSGVYKEKIHINKDGITLIGDGRFSTLITSDDSAAGGNKMAGSATLAVSGDGFIAQDIGFQNSAGPEGGQAVALKITSDRSVLYRCSIRGYQDTLYALALRQFYRDCDIHGTVDFVFGNAAAVFQNCYLILRRPQHKAYNVIFANGRSDPGQNTGFSIQNCKIMASSDLSPFKHSIPSYLGRPWKMYSRTVIMQSSIDDAIAPRGWIEWEGSFALKTLYFAEYLNVGPGAGTSKRVQWPSYHVIGSEEAGKFTVGRFIGGTSWLPSTGVTFSPGL
ncbi:pectinesterase-like [Magnolia sinica]|uniref:pectinesterase-like n=1 Tax=Magnolia sinica TaxID=86752 RepID=UPI00265945C8|nr:pectinesterase-like [Magnolia sinica]